MEISETAAREEDPAFNEASHFLFEAVIASLPEKYHDDLRCFWDPRPALDALLSPQSTECERCAGKGEIADTRIEGAAKFCRTCNRTLTFNFIDRPAAPHAHPCPSCNGSGRVEKGPIAYLSAELEPAGWVCDMCGWSMRPASYPGERHAHAMDGHVVKPVYRLPSESTNGVKDGD